MGYPLIIHLHRMFLNHPAIGVPPLMETPMILRGHLDPGPLANIHGWIEPIPADPLPNNRPHGSSCNFVGSMTGVWWLGCTFSDSGHGSIGRLLQMVYQTHLFFDACQWSTNHYTIRYGGFHTCGYPIMDGLFRGTHPWKYMILG